MQEQRATGGFLRVQGGVLRSAAAFLCWFAILMLGVWAVAAGPARAQSPDGGTDAALRAKYAALRQGLATSGFGRPLVLESRQASGALEGDLYAVVDFPLGTIGGELKSAGRWCDVLILHLNVKYCRASVSDGAPVLTMYVATRWDQPLSSAHHVHYRLRVLVETADYLRIQLAAETGPFGTKDFRIMLEAIPLEGGQSFIRMTYAYAFGALARIATETYLATAGRGKVGFTVLERHASGAPVYVGGMRGLVERNSMRYFLAVESYLGALSARPQEQLDKRLRDWFTATERYPRQLRELDEAQYLTMKHQEYQRQHTGVGAPAPPASR